jgi:hypothetical protein
MSEKLMDLAFRVAAELAPAALEHLGAAMWGDKGAEVGRAAGELVRESMR